jgi:secreted trypsin-like serine protease
MRWRSLIPVSFELIAAAVVFAWMPRIGVAADPAAANAAELEIMASNAALPAPYRQAVRNYLTKPVQQIIGGEAAKEGELPWQVSLGVASVPDPRWAHFCGGVLYRNGWIITAAHCVNGLQPGGVAVVAGVLELSQGVPRYGVDTILVKPGYMTDSFGNDVALVHLSIPLPNSASIQPIDIVSAQVEQTFVRRITQFTASGWGASMPVGLAVEGLQKVTLPYASPQDCSQPLSYPPDPQTGKALITDQMICAGKVDGGVSACQGDSGGPMVVYTGGVAAVVGVDSFAAGCGLPYKYNVYSRLNAYRPWLESNSAMPPAHH